MSNTLPATGLHKPITNILRSEASNQSSHVTKGSPGDGELQEIDEQKGIEIIPHLIHESAMLDFQAPDTSGLSDIALASFKSVITKEAVIGTDERIQVTESKKYPWRASASLLITAGDNSQWVGTAWFISPRVLITAGHCVYIKHTDIERRDGWVKKIQVMPGRNGNTLPFGGISATEFWTVEGWGQDGLDSYDYGAIVLPGPFPQNLGSFGYGVYKDEELLHSTINVAGYPADKSTGTIWYDNREIASVKPDKVYYEADTYGGQSGASVYQIKDNQRIAVAIHTYGGLSSNSGTRITEQLYANIEYWRTISE